MVIAITLTHELLFEVIASNYLLKVVMMEILLMAMVAPLTVHQLRLVGLVIQQMMCSPIVALLVVMGLELVLKSEMTQTA